MIPDITGTVQLIETEMPDMAWLVTKHTDRPPEKRYFGHVFLWDGESRSLAKSYKASADTPAAAIWEAYCAAKVAIN